jgi:hypothetical protein
MYIEPITGLITKRKLLVFQFFISEDYQILISSFEQYFTWE